jgi:hypothetical protein
MVFDRLTVAEASLPATGRLAVVLVFCFLSFEVGELNGIVDEH